MRNLILNKLQFISFENFAAEGRKMQKTFPKFDISLHYKAHADYFRGEKSKKIIKSFEKVKKLHIKNQEQSKQYNIL